MDLPTYLGTAQVADVLGVSVSTVKRWVDEGILPAHKTAGGHRKLLANDVARLVRDGDFPRLNWGRLAVETERQRERPTWETLADALERGDGPAVSATIRRCRDDGMRFAELGDEIVAPAMGRIGQAWESGRLDVLHEHRATQLMAAALYDLKERVERRAETNRPRAVVAGPEGDHSVLACLLIHLMLTEEGWESTLVGPNTPTESLCRAIREIRPKLACLSTCHLADAEALVASWPAVYECAQQAGAALAVGGRDLAESVRQKLRYNFHGDRLAHLADFARLLHPAPRRPRRGRPPTEC